MTIRDWTETDRVRLTPVAAIEELTPQKLVDLYADDVWRFVSSKLRRREDAEDAAMEAFACAMKHWDRVSKAQSPKLWLLTVARNKVHDLMRRAYRRAEGPLDELQAMPEEEPNEARDSLREALGEMPELQREALVLKYVNGLSTEEVARVIRKSAAATNSLLQRARCALRERALHLIEAQGGMA